MGKILECLPSGDGLGKITQAGGKIMPEQAHAVLEFRVNTLESTVNEIRSAIKSIDSSLQALARIEQHHQDTRDGLERAFTEIGDHETRIRGVEAEMPTVKQARTWIFSGAMGVVGMVGMAVVYLVLK
jgi:chromosome segregation ATPase